MPEMQNFDPPGVFLETVINADRRVQDFANAAAFGNGHPDPGKVLQKFKMVEKGCSKPFGGCRVIGVDGVEDDL